MSSSSIFGSAGAPITIGGLASGIDTSGIITALTQQETNAEQTYQTQESALNTQLQAWQAFNGTLLGLQSIAQSLSSPSSFLGAQASIDQSAVATVSAQSTAVAGNHTLTVNTLAQAQNVLSGSYSDSSVPLNITGSFSLNGKTITLASADTLTSLASKINSASAGVTATVISAGTGNFQLSLSSTQTGTVNALSASDLSGGSVLESLGLIPSSGATVGLRQSIANSTGGGAGSIALSSATEDVAGALGLDPGAAASGTIQIAGHAVAVNLNTMSLSDVANAINSAGIPNVQAQIVSIPDANGNTGPLSPKQLQIVSTSSGSPISASSFTDDGGVLSSLGILQTGFSNQVTGAQDASFQLDGINYTRSYNQVNDALTGVSLTLLSTNTSSTSTPANISVSQNTSSIMGTINNFVLAYNGVVDGINAQMTYSGATSAGGGDSSGSTPPLFGDTTLTNLQNQLANMASISSGGSSLANIGITLNNAGELVVDSSKLQTALAANPTQVAGLFGVSGAATNSAVQFVTAGVNTQASTAQGYDVDITQAASQGSVTAGAAFAAAASPETLSFTGGLFGSTTTKLTIPTGATLQQTIGLINSNSTLNQYLYASQNSSGELVLTSKGYGASQAFTVTSDQASGGTGIGTAGLSAAGTDVAGTINGEPATGLGQSLIGNSGNKTTDGLQLKITATAPGNYGTVTVSHGLADELNALVTSATDTTNGAIATAESAINTQITDVQKQVTSMQAEISSYTTYLQQQFANMESSVAQLQAQQQAFTAQVSSTSGLFSSSSSSSSSSKA